MLAHSLFSFFGFLLNASIQRNPQKKTPMTGVLVLLVRGAARSRTAVQTGNPYAFYMFSQSLVVGKEPAKGYKLNP